MRFSALKVLTQGLTGNRGWREHWRDPEPAEAYDIVIIGGGGHGLSTAYYLAKEHGLKRIAVLEKGYIVIEIRLQSFPELQGMRIEFRVPRQKVIGPNNGCITSNIAATNVALLQHGNALEPMFFCQVVGGR